MPDRADEQNHPEDLFEVTVERILPGGFGLAHADGRTLMVALAAPGDRLRVRVERVKGSVAFASIVVILEPSPVRVEPPCPYFGRCGGCDFQQLNYQAQLDAKIEIIRDCLRRLARIEPVPDFQIRRAPNQWHYRARAQWQNDAVRQRLGYFEANSHRVCDVAECAVLVPELQRELESLREEMKRGTLPDARYFRAVVGDQDVSVVDDRGVSPTTRESSLAVEVTRTIRGERYRLNAESFFQTNIDLLPQLIDYALGDVRGQAAVELYCGVGLFTVPLARQFERVVAIEDDDDATKFARQNLESAGLQNTEVVNQNVADWLDLECGSRVPMRRERRFGSSSSSDPTEPLAANPIQSAVDAGALQIDFLLLDPPRTGAESRVISGILNLKPQKICYVSCDPATLARDLKKLIAGGYSINSMQAFDMFPQTHHVETVVHLQHSGSQ
ncbi:MAG TPA: class I SAM-dependent RNA methyltransferase [Pyrinomonadaceae bacterium]